MAVADLLTKKLFIPIVYSWLWNRIVDDEGRSSFLPLLYCLCKYWRIHYIPCSNIFRFVSGLSLSLRICPQIVNILLVLSEQLFYFNHKGTSQFVKAKSCSWIRKNMREHCPNFSIFYWCNRAYHTQWNWLTRHYWIIRWDFTSGVIRKCCRKSILIYANLMSPLIWTTVTINVLVERLLIIITYRNSNADLVVINDYLYRSMDEATQHPLMCGITWWVSNRTIE